MPNLDTRRVLALLMIGGIFGFLAVATEASWRELVGAVSGAAIGVLLVYGYQRWIKRTNRGSIDRRR